ncbi:hypothetical protein I5M32_02105 [Pedobacter sp. SD-b]|uniref:DUF4397 domain-containing protein n=1 Tax=Pedobacter segetis TaxID=2793069 RepID=A0ABS1BG19_9SPHI|nr:hypothetical protein [Pedobacter segetis]MBK0381741.1 hypothetical protein [Pedobacter segetis]
MKISTQILLLVIIPVFIVGCSKNDGNKIKDCERYNYGIITLKYASNSPNAHGVDTYVPKYKRKTLNKGLFQDTLHFSPGTYKLDVFAFDNAGIPIQNKHISQTVNITSCSEQVISTDF